MLIGEFHHNLDEKGRIIIPSKFRDDLGNKVVVTRGLDGCLFVYSINEWNNIVSKLKSLSFTKKDARMFNRFILCLLLLYVILIVKVGLIYQLLLFYMQILKGMYDNRG